MVLIAVIPTPEAYPDIQLTNWRWFVPLKLICTWKPNARKLDTFVYNNCEVLFLAHQRFRNEVMEAMKPRGTSSVSVVHTDKVVASVGCSWVDSSIYEAAIKHLPSNWCLYFYNLGCGSSVIPAIRMKKSFWFNERSDLVFRSLPTIIKSNCKPDMIEYFMSQSFFHKLQSIPTFASICRSNYPDPSPPEADSDEEIVESEDEELTKPVRSNSKREDRKRPKRTPIISDEENDDDDDDDEDEDEENNSDDEESESELDKFLRLLRTRVKRKSTEPKQLVSKAIKNEVSYLLQVE